MTLAKETYHRLNKQSSGNLNTWIHLNKPTVQSNHHKTRRQMQEALEIQIRKAEE